MVLGQTWFGSRFGSVFGGSVGLRFGFWGKTRGSVGSRFGIFRFVPIPNEKFTHFLTFYEVKTFGSVRGSVFFGRFGGSKFSF